MMEQVGMSLEAAETLLDHLERRQTPNGRIQVLLKFSEQTTYDVTDVANDVFARRVRPRNARSPEPQPERQSRQ